MWSTFVVQDEEARATATSGRGPEVLAGMMGARSGGGKRRARVSSPSLSESHEGKIKLAFLVATVGITLSVLGVGTEFWVEMAPSKNLINNETCQIAYFGLWKSCLKTILVANVDPELETCGPLDLPGDLSVTSAMLAIFSLFLMIMGAICIIMAISKGVQFFLKPASVCFTLSGLLVYLSLIIFHQSVLSLLASDNTIPLYHELSWSVTCMGCAGTILIVAGGLFLLLALPYRPWEKCYTKRNNGS